MSAAAIAAAALAAPEPELEAQAQEWCWIVIDPDGRCYGVADSFRSCLEAAREAPEIVLDQIVRVPTESIRAGIYWSRLEVSVRAHPQQEISFP